MKRIYILFTIVIKIRTGEKGNRITRFSHSAPLQSYIFDDVVALRVVIYGCLATLLA